LNYTHTSYVMGKEVFNFSIQTWILDACKHAITIRSINYTRLFSIINSSTCKNTVCGWMRWELFWKHCCWQQLLWCLLWPVRIGKLKTVMISVSWGLYIVFISFFFIVLFSFVQVRLLFFPTIDIKIVPNLRDSSSMYYD
jgi:hypothetical protein